MPVSRFHDLRPQQRPPEAAEVYSRMHAAPKFVFSNEVIEWIKERSGYLNDARAAAIGAGRTELPYPTMLVEWEEGREQRLFWLIEEAAPNDYRIWWAGHFPRESNDLVFGPHFSASFNQRGEAVVKSPIYSMPHLRSLIDECRPTAGIALCLAMTLHIRGIITREPSAPDSPKHDAKRIKKGKLPITKDYRTVHIGYVTDRHGKRHDYEEGRGHVRPHLRRGHHKNQAFGPGRLDRKEIWIEAYLVNYGPDAKIDPSPQYLVVP